MSKQTASKEIDAIQPIQAEVEEEAPGIYKIGHNEGPSIVLPKSQDSLDCLPKTFDDHLRLEKHRLESAKIKLVLDEWKNQQEADRAQRNRFGTWILAFLGFQLLAFSISFVLCLAGILYVDNAALPIWTGALVIEVIGLALIIAKGLFVNTTAEFFQVIKSLLNGRENE